MMDIALPRDIDPQINSLDNVELYDIDDLKKIHDENGCKRAELAAIAHDMIQDKIDDFIIWLDSANIDPTIKSLKLNLFFQLPIVGAEDFFLLLQLFIFRLQGGKVRQLGNASRF